MRLGKKFGTMMKVKNQNKKIFKKGCVKDGKYNKYPKIWKY